MALYGEREHRGEYVLVVAGAQPEEETTLTLEEGVQRVLRLREDGMKKMCIRDSLATMCSLPHRIKSPSRAWPVPSRTSA